MSKRRSIGPTSSLPCYQLEPGRRGVASPAVGGLRESRITAPSNPASRFCAENILPLSSPHSKVSSQRVKEVQHEVID